MPLLTREGRRRDKETTQDIDQAQRHGFNPENNLKKAYKLTLMREKRLDIPLDSEHTK